MNRIQSIDYLKTLAIIGVLLYHAGFADNGYLAVEVFFVISGYLFLKGIHSDLDRKTFNPVKFIFNKISAFWPLIAIGSVFSLLIGSFNMLPDDFENVASSVVASNTFMNNILQAITTRNYWDVVNVYKPLMHTWYIGVLLQSFVFISIILWISMKILKNNHTKTVLCFITLFSLALYILPFFSEAVKFYFIPFRLFEITLGGLIVYLPKPKFSDKLLRILGYIAITVILVLTFGMPFLSSQLSLLLVVASTVVTVYTHGSINEKYGISEKVYQFITLPGKYSYDIYIWHQIVIAFLYYSFFEEANFIALLFVILVTSILTILTVYIRKHVIIFKSVNKRIIFAACLSVISCIFALYIYLHAGVVRDVPELGIDKDNVHQNMHAEYVDIPYSWDNDFTSADKTHILVVGNSFGRDFANILNESEYSDELEISYYYGDNPSSEMDRIEQADYIFYGTDSWDIPATLSCIPKEKLYIVGNKIFGKSNGIFYINRNKDWYFTQSFELSNDMITNNNNLREIYSDHYIDMITPLLDKNKIKIFTDDNHYISQDCRHLTKHGAMFYSRILDLDFLNTNK